ncbi:MFS transporter [Clostridium beijerinckii]|uniref:MFS transporter n=1 Tax=Clostridium beijerinckii TaxID=1520 RepID=UPI0003D3A8ED|nr:MFS transporter [Clostridium beijerinckii]ALB45195.1 DHA2 family efflux MFS transporter permease subunit [Clostridium beijerinckii NRRL B-598]
MEKTNRLSLNKASSGLVIFVLSLTTLMSAIDTSIVNIGLPTIARAFNADFASLQWIALSYLLAVTSLIVGIGRIGDIFGKKNIFIYGIIIFTVASLLCGISTSIYELIIFRALQGIGGSILITLSFAIAGDLVPKEKLIQSMGILTSMLPIGFALGPSVGGFLISLFGWRYIFFINIPMGTLALILTMKFHEIPISKKKQKFDFLGMLILTSTLICYVLSVTLAEEQGFSAEVIGLAIIAIIGIIVFIFLEKNITFPLIDLKLFRNSVLSSSLVISILVYTVISGAVVILPFYLQQAKGFTTASSGLLMMTGPIGCAIFTPIAGRAAKRFGNFTVMIFGIFALCIGTLLMSMMNLSSSAVLFAIVLFVFNGSLAFFQTPNNASIISMAKPEQRGLASGLLNLSRTIGQTTGAAVIGAIFYLFNKTKTMDSSSPENITAGIHNTFLIAALIMACGLILGVITLSSKKERGDRKIRESLF